MSATILIVDDEDNASAKHCHFFKRARLRNHRRGNLAEASDFARAIPISSPFHVQLRMIRLTYWMK
jgi:hypothetical protein